MTYYQVMLKFIRKYNYHGYFWQAELKFLGRRFWTSISNEGPNIKNYLQCASKVTKTLPSEFKNETFWVKKKSNTPKLQRCLALKVEIEDNILVFQHKSCTIDKQIFICEVNAGLIYSSKL
jgi:hypothetical protein